MCWLFECVRLRCLCVSCGKGWVWNYWRSWEIFIQNVKLFEIFILHHHQYSVSGESSSTCVMSCCLAMSIICNTLEKVLYTSCLSTVVPDVLSSCLWWYSLVQLAVVWSAKCRSVKITVVSWYLRKYPNVSFSLKRHHMMFPECPADWVKHICLHSFCLIVWKEQAFANDQVFVLCWQHT